MKEDVIIRECSHLRKQAVKVFGDIVTKAYVTCPKGYNNEQATKALLDREMLYSIPREETETMPFALDFDCSEIWLQFVNGVTVEFSASEWAFMRQVEFKNAQQL